MIPHVTTLCYFTLYLIILYYIIVYYITLHYIISYYIIYYILLYPTISYHILPYPITSYHILSHPIISYHIISYHIISYHIISYIISLLDENNHFCVSGHTSFAWQKSLPVPPSALYRYQEPSESLTAHFSHHSKRYSETPQHLLPKHVSSITVPRSSGVSRTLRLTARCRSRALGWDAGVSQR